jgi:hypothetical protein
MNGTRLLHKIAQKDTSVTTWNIGETIIKILILCLTLQYLTATSNGAMIQKPHAKNRNVYFSQVMSEYCTHWESQGCQH